MREKAGPNPADRRKAGSEYHLFVYAGGTPLNVILTGANRSRLDPAQAIASWPAAHGRPVRATSAQTAVHSR